MEKWWRERFIDRRAWILDHLEDLSLSSEEAMTILLIDFFNEHDTLTLESFCLINLVCKI